jgi:hypothetical protein
MNYFAYVPEDFLRKQEKIHNEWHMPDFRDTITLFNYCLFVRERIKRNLDTAQKMIAYKFLINLERS